MKKNLLRSRLAAAAALLGGGVTLAAAPEWPQVSGPGYDRKTTETVSTSWPGKAPKPRWEIPVDGGFGSFVTGDGRAYLVIAAKDRETAIAVDRKTGKTLWSTPLGPVGYTRGGDRGARGNDGGDGPRATPAFADGRVFVFGGKFDLYALDAGTGKIVWKHDVIREFGGKELHWSNASAPLVVGDRVFVVGGGKDQAYLAFRADTGAVIWKAGTDRATYATPTFATIHGKEQILYMVERGVVSRDPADGKELWHYPFPYRTATAASPVVWQDIVNCAAGYGVGGGACKVTRTGDAWEVAEIWRSPGNRETAIHWSTPVVHEGYVYGYYGHGAYGDGPFKCVDIRTGKVQWEKSGFGHGQVIMAGGKLLATTDGGKLVLIEPTPEKYRELASADVVEGKVWASLALSDGQVFLRSTKEAVCLEWQ